MIIFSFSLVPIIAENVLVCWMIRSLLTTKFPLYKNQVLIIFFILLNLLCYLFNSQMPSVSNFFVFLINCTVLIHFFLSR